MNVEAKPFPLISVIIPTYNRKDSLLRTLDSLSQQSYPAERFEVIVVDDGGSDGTEAITQRPFPFLLRYLRQENQGEVMARNRAAQHSAGQHLIFLDDDIETNPQYLTTLMAVHAARPRAVVLATLVEVPAGLPSDHPQSSQPPTLHAGDRTPSEPEPMTFIGCMSGIVSIARSDFFEIGAMQPLRSGEGRNTWGGIDFGYRAQQHGFSFWRASSAIAYHHDDALTSLQARCSRSYRVSCEVHYLFAKYPAVRGQIPMFRDKEPVAWRQDPPRLILRKLARQVIWSRPAMWAMQRAVPFLERRAPESSLLASFYQWIVSGYIFRGYRDGLRAAAQRPAA